MLKIITGVLILITSVLIALISMVSNLKLIFLTVKGLIYFMFLFLSLTYGYDYQQISRSFFKFGLKDWYKQQDMANIHDRDFYRPIMESNIGSTEQSQQDHPDCIIKEEYSNDSLIQQIDYTTDYNPKSDNYKSNKIGIQTQAGGQFLNSQKEYNNHICMYSKLLNIPIQNIPQTQTVYAPFPQPLNEWMSGQFQVSSKNFNKDIVLIGTSAGSGLHLQGTQLLSKLLNTKARYLFGRLKLPTFVLADSPQISFMESVQKDEYEADSLDFQFCEMLKMFSRVATDDNDELRNKQSLELQDWSLVSKNIKFLFVLDENDIIKDQNLILIDKMKEVGLNISLEMSDNKWHSWINMFHFQEEDIIELFERIKKEQF